MNAENLQQQQFLHDNATFLGSYISSSNTFVGLNNITKTSSNSICKRSFESLMNV